MLAFAIRHRWLTTLLLLMVYLYAGLNGGFTPKKNNVTFDSQAGALTFAKHSRAHTSPPTDIKLRENYDIAIRLQLDDPSIEQGGCILSISNGEPSTQLVLWQYKNQIIFMQGYDYSYRHRQPRIYVNLNRDSDFGPILDVHIRANQTQTTLTVKNSENQKEKVKKIENIFQVDLKNASITLGNDIKNQLDWRGKVYALSVKRDNTSINDYQFSFDTPAHQNNQYKNNGTRPRSLLAPDHHALLNIELFSSLITRLNTADIGKRDIALNFLGFIPWGLLVFFIVSANKNGWRPILIACASGFSLSFCIEFTQGFLAARDSSQMDLLLNTLGATFGALVGFYSTQKYCKFLREKS